MSCICDKLQKKIVGLLVSFDDLDVNDTRNK
jgi:hypothetical protein